LSKSDEGEDEGVGGEGDIVRLDGGEMSVMSSGVLVSDGGGGVERDVVDLCEDLGVSTGE
jgi:hypothetical protein